MKRLLLIALYLVAAVPATATVFTVTNTADSGPGSLRAAILAANADGTPPSTINFTVSGTITLLTSLPGIAPSGGSTINIIGPGQASLTVSGAGAVPVFAVTGAGSVSITDLTVANGAAVGGAGGSDQGGGGGGGPGLGGGLYVGSAASSVSVSRVTFTSNSATGGAGGGGGSGGAPGGNGGGSSVGLGAGGTGGGKGGNGNDGVAPYGGGGGGSDQGGSGGNGAFGSGGGGGAGTGATLGVGGAAGLGGGAGGNGFGSLGNGGGGGGAGLGGAIYVEAGPTVLLGDVTIQGNSVAAGAGGLGNGGFNGSAGQASGSAIFLSNGGVTYNVSAGSVTVNGVIADQRSLVGGLTAASLTKTGAGTLILSGANNYSGGTSVLLGTLQGDTTSLQGNITNNGTVNFNQGGFGTYAGSVSGTGQLLLTGGGTLVLTGGNTYSGGTTITASTLQGNTSSLQGNVVDNGSLVFTQGFNGTFSGNVTGTGSLTKSGNGTLILAGTNSYTGGTTISAGTLQGDTNSLQGDIADGTSLVFNQGFNGTYTGVISGSGSVTKQGAGTVTLNSVSTYAGATNIAAGTLRLGANNGLSAQTDVTVTGTFDMNGFSDTIGSLSGSGSVIFDDIALVTNGNGASTTFSGTISGAGGLTKQGSGTLTLTGANTYAGATVVSAGTLRLGAFGAVPSMTNLTVASGATFNMNGNAQYVTTLSGGGSVMNGGGAGLVVNGGTSTFSGVISTFMPVTVQNGANLTLSGVNTYTGLTTIDSTSTLKLGINNALSSQTEALVNGLLDMNGFSDTIGSLEGNGTVLDSGAGLTVGGNNSTTTFQGVITGSGGLTLTGTGTLTLSGANTYTGATTITSGTLKLGANGALPSATALTVTGTFDMNGFSTTIGSLSGSGNVINDNNVGGLQTNGSNASTLFSGSISGTGGLMKLGTGTLTLSGVNTFTGATNIAAGTLKLGVANALSTSTDVTVTGTFDMNSFSTTIGSLSGAGNVTNDNGALGLITNGNGATTTFSGVISGSSGLTKVGNGTLTLSGLNTFTGATLISAGTLQLGIDNALPQTTAVTVSAAGIWDMGGKEDTIGSLAGSGNVINNSGSCLFVGADNTSTTYAGVISGSGSYVQKIGTGTLTLTSSVGALQSGGATRLSGGTLAGTTSSLSGDFSFQQYAPFPEPTANLTFNQSFNGTYAGSISDDGTIVDSVTKLGTGTVQFSGNNTYSGATVISAGTLQLGSATALPNLTPLTVSGTLDMNGFAATVSSLTGNGRVINDNAPAGLDVVIGNNLSSNFAGTISGTSGLTKDGAGTLTLSGTNTYTGATNILAGTLQLGVVNATSAASAFTVTGTLDLNGFGTTIGSLSGAGNVINDNSLLGLSTNGNGASTFYSGVISGSGGLTKQGNGTLGLGGANLYTGATVIAAGTLELDNASALPSNTALTINGGASLDMNGFNATIGSLSGNGTVFDPGDPTLTVGGNGQDSVFGGVITGDIALVKVGAGTLTLTGANDYTGGTTVSAGTLTGTTTSLQGSITDNAAVVFDQSFNGTYADVISGTGSVTKQGTGTVIFTGANNYTGGTTISAGTLQGNTTSLQGNIVDNASLVFDQAADGTFAGVISGTGSVTKQNAGTLTLGAVNTYGGATNVLAGTLRLGVDNALSSQTSVTVTSTLDVNGVSDTIGSLAGAGSVTLGGSALSVGGNGASTNFSGVISGAGTLTKVGAGTQTLSGANTFLGTTTVTGGTLSVNGSLATPVIVGPAGTLGGTGTVGATTVNGVVAPGNSIGTLTVNGNFTQATGSTYQAELNAAGQSDLLSATGTATIQNGTTAQLIAAAGNYGVGQRFTILNAAGGRTGTYTTLTSNFAGSVRPTLVYDADTVQVVLLTRFSQTPNLTHNQATIAAILDEEGFAQPTGDLLLVLNTLDTLSGQALKDALQQVAPEELGNTAAADVQISRELLNTVVSRLHEVLGLGNTWGGGAQPSQDPLQYVMAPDDLAPMGGAGGPAAAPGEGRDLRWGTWATGFGGSGDVSGNDEADGFRSTSGGVAAGLDFRPDRDGVVGLVAGGAWTNLEGKDLAGNADISSASVGLYGGHAFGRFYADASAGYTHHDIDTSRPIVFGGISREAKGNHEGQEFDGNFEFGYKAAEGDFKAQPFFGLSYTSLDEDSFDESGAGVLDLHVDSATTESLRTALGVRVAWDIRAKSGVRWLPQIEARWEHQCLDTGNSTNATFTGFPGQPSFTVRGVDVDEDAGVIGVGLGARFSESVGAFVGYQGRFGDLETDHQGQGGIEIRW